MSSPRIVTHIFEAMPEVQSLGIRVSLVYEQSYGRYAKQPCFLLRRIEQLAGYALPPIAALHGNAVYIQLARLGLIGH